MMSHEQCSLLHLHICHPDIMYNLVAAGSALRLALLRHLTDPVELKQS